MLAGNHEEVFLDVLDGDLDSLRLFTRIGGRETILSYGVSEHDYDRLDSASLSARIREAVHEHHIAFLRRAEDVIEIGHYAFVHAGVCPGVDLADQRAADLRWIRNRFLRHEGDSGKLINNGQQITDAPRALPHPNGIENGAFASGPPHPLGPERTGEGMGK